MIIKKDSVIAVLLTFCLSIILFRIMPIGSQSVWDYDPWYDMNDDGIIDMRDISGVAIKFGAQGDPINKTALLYNMNDTLTDLLSRIESLNASVISRKPDYDSGWIDIVDKCGQYFNITHNLNNTEILVDIQGKTILGGGVHQIHLDGTGYESKQLNKTYGSIDDDWGRCLVQTSDGGYLLAGDTQSYGVGGRDLWLVKVGPKGELFWNVTFGGANDDVPLSVIQTSDGGYVLAGYTRSYSTGVADFWLVKTDVNGGMQWNWTYGGTSDDVAYSVVETVDGGYTLAGYTRSFGAGGYDAWLVKTNSSGNMEWSRTYGGACDDSARCMIQTVDGGYALAGKTCSFGAGSDDFFFVKTDQEGRMLWSRTYGGSDYDTANSIVQTVDGGYALGGHTISFGAGADDFWLVKTDVNGGMQWNWTYGGVSPDIAYSVVQAYDDGYVVAGDTWSFSAGSWDFWLVKTDLNGNHLWNKTFGGKGIDRPRDVIATREGGYAIVGETWSFGSGGADFWLIGIDRYGRVQVVSWFKYGLAWTDSTIDTITLYRGVIDPHWNYVRVRIWKIKES